MERIKVMLVDNKEVFREGLARLLEEKEYIEVVSQCNTGEQAIDKAKEIKPDVVLIGTEISGISCNETTREIKELLPEIKIAMIADYDSEQALFSAIESGAIGYLSKDMKVDDFTKSVDLIGKGESIVSPPLSEKLVVKFASMRQKEPELQTGLTQQEIEIVKLLAKGATNKEIAETLFVTENTAKVHLKNILGKLGLRNRQQVAAYAVQQGLVAEITLTEEEPG
jgi:NarL family two-component system response regulator LiaR